jgi:hypothetical protein
MLAEGFGLLRRRWVTALPAVAVAVAACVQVSHQVHPAYESTSQMMFLLPAEQPDPDVPPINPYLNLPSGLGTSASLIANILSTDDVADDLAARGLDADYTVVAATETGPLLVVTSTASDAQMAERTRDALMRMVDQELVEIQTQAGTPDNQVMTATRLMVSSKPDVLHGPVYKAMAAAVAGGLLLVLLVCFVVDRLLGRRRRRPGGGDDAAAVPSVPPRERTPRLRLPRKAAASRPVDEPAADPVADPVAEPVDEPVDEPVREPDRAPVGESVRQPVGEDERADPPPVTRPAAPGGSPSLRHRNRSNRQHRPPRPALDDRADGSRADLAG